MYTTRRIFRSFRQFCSNANDAPTTHGILRPNVSLPLASGSTLPASSIQIHYATWGHKSNPTVLIAPSMSNSCFVTEHPDIPKETKHHGGLWWTSLVGNGEKYPINTQKYHVISFTPLGSPFGSTSPLTRNEESGRIYGSDFPTITPSDQARFIKLGLDALQIQKPLHAIVGGSMGGMQILEFAVQFPELYERICAIATTGWTSPSTVALRSIQRKIVKLDPNWNNSNIKEEEILQGLVITRMIGTICYRSREEFDDRFDWYLREDNRFEVDDYLDHQGQKFAGYYDSNCYLSLSECMDRMNLGFGFDSFEEGVLRIPNDKEIMLLSYDSDYLIPPSELSRLSAILGHRKHSKVYYECLHSMYGHDTFLIQNEMKQIGYRIKPFLEESVREVERIVSNDLM